MQGGKFVTVGKNEATVTYNFPIEVVPGTTSPSISTCGTPTNVPSAAQVHSSGMSIICVSISRATGTTSLVSSSSMVLVNASQRQFAIRNGVGIKNATL